MKSAASPKENVTKKIATQRLRASHACDNSFILPQRFEFTVRAEKSARRQAGCHLGNRKPLFCRVIRSAKPIASSVF